MADWSTFTKRIAIRATLSDVYRAWATQKGIESWFLRRALYTSKGGEQRKPGDFVQDGDAYLWNWHGYPNSVKEENEIVMANGKDQLQFTFTGDCLVTVKLTEEKGYTLVSLTQEGIPEDNNPRSNLYVGCGEGWTFYLANLKSILEGGIDLRNKDESIQSVINS